MDIFEPCPSFENFLKEALAPQPFLRAGQNLINVLHRYRPDLYYRILDLDEKSTLTLGVNCFYEDKYLWHCVYWLKDNWDRRDHEFRRED